MTNTEWNQGSYDNYERGWSDAQYDDKYPSEDNGPSYPDSIDYMNGYREYFRQYA